MSRGHEICSVKVVMITSEPPDVPSNMRVQDAGSRWVSLAWGAPGLGDPPVLHYVLQHRPVVQGDWSNTTVEQTARNVRLMVSCPPQPTASACWPPTPRAPARPAISSPSPPCRRVSTCTFLIFSILRPAVVYLILLGSVSASDTLANTSSESPCVECTCLIYSIPAPHEAPVDISAKATSPNSMVVQWKPPKQGRIAGEVLGYRVTCREVSAGSQQVRVVRRASRLEVSLQHLRPYTRYEVTVRAYNGVGAGPPSLPATITTLETASGRTETVNVFVCHAWRPIHSVFGGSDPKVGRKLGYDAGLEAALNCKGRRKPGISEKNPPTSGTVRHDSHEREFGKFAAVSKHEFTLPQFTTCQWWEASRQTAQPPQPPPSTCGLQFFSMESEQEDKLVLCAFWEMSKEQCVDLSVCCSVPDEPPEDVHCAALSAQSMRVTWEPPLPDHRHGAIEGYKVLYSHANLKG
ncbi:hypothetical protein PR048_024406 [Dryococelus australis]|uniref:Fibronectin type-III domain-containing protein n=1 Tax=Dryococelus australis TaxID=614101 RepID=A0ABQ9GNH1_9NEOP|nr:hypothetical protein PR048_024406 [Dryococelus australis]